MWSLGCILYELVTHQMLFDYKDPKENLIKAMAINNSFDLNCFDAEISKSLIDDYFIGSEDFINETIKIVLPNRIFNIEDEIMKYHNDKVLIDFIKRCLVLDPKKRLTPGNARLHPFMKKKFSY